jgi:cysteine desulfurase
MAKYLYNQEIQGNPSSKDHVHGMTAAIALTKARIKIAKFINAESKENIIFTSGATESNNIAISQFNKGIITSPIEHTSVDECAIKYQNRHFIPLNSDLSVNFGQLIPLIGMRSSGLHDTDLISCIGASNEIGTIMPIHEIGAFCKTHKIPFHCDATQLAPWQKIDVQKDNIDFLSLSAHKLYGPQGVGALYVKNPEILKNLTCGGKQEFTKRPGTQNMVGIIGFAKAVEIIESDREADVKKVALLRSKMEKKFYDEFQDIPFHINGGDNRIPNNLSITFDMIDDGLLELVNTWISVSNGSACHGGAMQMSPIMKYLGHKDSSQTLRIGLGRFTTEEDVDKIIRVITDGVRALKI